MPRSGKVDTREVAPDVVFSNTVVTKLINKIMISGKKSVASKIVYGAFEEIKNAGQDPVKVFEKALENVTPKMEVRPRRVGGASYMVPLEVRGPRRLALALKWLVDAARNRTPQETGIIKNKPLMMKKLAQEILDAAQGTGKAIAKKEDMHRMAEANKAFAHFRW